ncbi:TolC family protein [Kaistia adipata]|uniref:TolC family protein n=1 Tax=Kaistia adipata TaxID=166954 RepID=UPI00041AE36F|nr:TolC family protein [Kaistia adipata]
MILRLVASTGLLALISGCAQYAEQLAPDSPSEPWQQGRKTGPSLLPQPASARQGPAATDFGVRGMTETTALSAPPETQPGKVYQLPELIDISARHNPATRVAWEQARQAALAVGIAESTFLPTLSANVIGGSQQNVTPVDVLGQTRDIKTTVDGSTSAVALQWLIFDFGQRRAAANVAKQLSTAANINFNGAHQLLIFNVTRAYYQYGATQTGAEIAGQSLRNSRAILDAAVAREKNGLGTTVEVAQARQQVAQSELRQVTAAGLKQDAYQALLAAMGVSPTMQIKVAGSGSRRLPAPSDVSTEEMIEQALARRPDVLASYAAMKAGQAGIDVAKADFMPKVYMAGVAGQGTGGFDASGLPTIGQQTSGTGILVGAAVPLYDGGLRAANLKAAESRAAAARATFHKTQEEAVREMVVASNTLRSALASYRAASKLTDAASVTYDAALDAYRNGLGTVTAATAADSGLLDARQARTDAHAASLIAAANLAFVLGTMTSPQAADSIRYR